MSNSNTRDGSSRLDGGLGSQLDDVDLMLYVDGEVDAASAAEIAALIAEDEEAGAKVESLRQMDDVLASYLELAADDQAPRLDAMWSTIEQHIAEERVADESAAEASAPAAAEPRELDEVWTRSRAQPEPESRGIWSAINRWLEGYRGHILTGAAAVAAAALLVMALRSESKVVIQPPSAGNGDGSGSELVQVNDKGQKSSPPGKMPGQTPGETNPAQTMPAAIEPPEINSLDFADGSGYVIQLPSEGEDDVDATVIFVDMDMNDVEGPL